MILVGNQRGGAKDLALHLMKEENDQVAIHELRGFVADDLMGALNESYAISRGTRCKQFMFSLSLNPPPNEAVKTKDFENAIERAEKELGLHGQPRAVVFHEKEGRRHCHVVWSRINTDEMKAIHLPYTHKRLQGLARELYIEHEWQMPRGLVDGSRNPLNYTLAQYQQARRARHDPKELKAFFLQCWLASDGQKSFAAALKERGLYLSQGDRRGHVAVDHKGEVYAISKWTDNRVKEVRAKLGDQTLEFDNTLSQGNATRQKKELVRALMNGADPFEKAHHLKHFKHVETTRTKQTRRLMTPSEVLAMPEDRAIVFISGKNLDPLYLHKRPYFEERAMAGLFLPNPHHPPLDRVRIKTRFGRKWRKIICEPVPGTFACLPQYQSGFWTYVHGFNPINKEFTHER